MDGVSLNRIDIQLLIVLLFHIKKIVKVDINLSQNWYNFQWLITDDISERFAYL